MSEKNDKTNERSLAGSYRQARRQEWNISEGSLTTEYDAAIAVNQEWKDFDHSTGFKLTVDRGMNSSHADAYLHLSPAGGCVQSMASQTLKKLENVMTTPEDE